MDTVITADNKTVSIGDRVFNYYDGKWGTIVGPIDNDGWFYHRADDGKCTSLNGERICQTIPKSSHWYVEYSETFTTSPKHFGVCHFGHNSRCVRPGCDVYREL